MAGAAKTLKERQVKTALAYIEGTRRPERNKVMFLLSCKAGLRAMEIAQVTWLMVTDSDGRLHNQIDLHKTATKGQKGGRVIPMAKVLLDAIHQLEIPEDLNRAIIQSERGAPMSAASVANWFWLLYEQLGFSGCSSHSGRRTFGTNAAHKVYGVGGTLRDVQKLMGHKSLESTQHYIDETEEAQRKLVEII